MKTIMMNSDILNKGELSPNKFLSPKAHKVSLQDKQMMRSESKFRDEIKKLNRGTLNEGLSKNMQ